MQRILTLLTNKLMAWFAWILIPIVMEIIPSFCGFVVLLKKKIFNNKEREQKYLPQITLIIPVYNSGDTLMQCLDSVLKSDYPVSKISVLLVNNGSKDNSYEIFKDYQRMHLCMDLKWFNSKQGKSKALNMALFHSNGKYIIHIDSDGLLEKSALKHMVLRFEQNENVHCMTGSILTTPETIEKKKKFFKKLVQEIEFYEYANAFLAGRNFEAELNSIFTLSGAFSAFRKSTILRTRLYNPQTVCEDTHMTFQVRKLLKKKIDICEKAIFFVEPIESFGNLYVQRQRWQRGEIEVAHMFPEKDNIIKGFTTSFMSRLMVFDHTFAFPRMIWYFALLCLCLMDYPFEYVVISVLCIYVCYCLTGFLNYINICTYLNWNEKLKNYYAKKVYIVLVLPIFNVIVYWFRMAGIINSIKGTSTWRTKSFKEERASIKDIIKEDLKFIKEKINKIKALIYTE